MTPTEAVIAVYAGLALVAAAPFAASMGLELKDRRVEKKAVKSFDAHTEQAIRMIRENHS